MEVSCTHKTKTIYSLRCGSRASGCHQMSLCVPSFALSAHHKMWGKLNAMKFVFKGQNNEEWVIEIQCFVLVRTPATEVHTPEPHTPLTDSPVWQQRPSGPSAWCWRSPAGNACSWTEDMWCPLKWVDALKKKNNTFANISAQSSLTSTHPSACWWDGPDLPGRDPNTELDGTVPLQLVDTRCCSTSPEEEERESRKERIQVTKRDRYEKIS